VRGAFGVAQAEAVKGREVLVVDDVYTTGATVSRVRAGSAPRGSNQGLGCDRGPHTEGFEHHVEIQFSGDTAVDEGLVAWKYAGSCGWQLI